MDRISRLFFVIRVCYQVGMRHLRAPVSGMAADVAAAEAFRRGLGWHLLLQVISVVHFAVALYEPAIKDAANFALPVHVVMLVLRLVVNL